MCIRYVCLPCNDRPSHQFQQQTLNLEENFKFQNFSNDLKSLIFEKYTSKYIKKRGYYRERVIWKCGTKRKDLTKEEAIHQEFIGSPFLHIIHDEL